MLCVMCITNSLRLTDKERAGEEFHKSVPEWWFISCLVTVDARGTFVFTYRTSVWFLVKYYSGANVASITSYGLHAIESEM